MGMKQKYATIDILAPQSYIISFRDLCCTSAGVDAFKKRMKLLDGTLIINDESLEKIKDYIEELAKDINKQYSDADLVLHFYENWHAKYSFGYAVWSDYCDWPACEIYFVKARNAVKIIELK